MERDRWDTEQRQTWQSFLAVGVQLVERLDHELQYHHDLTLVDYEILSELAEAPDDRLRMSELATQVLVSRSRLTYRIDRLTAVEFVVREECEDDRRGMWAIITDRGRQACDEARISHEASVDAWFLDHLSPEEQQALRVTMGRVLGKLSA